MDAEVKVFQKRSERAKFARIEVKIVIRNEADGYQSLVSNFDGL